MRHRIPMMAVLGLVVALALWLLVFRGKADTAVVSAGTVEVTEAELGFQLPGRVDSIAVREGDTVTAQQPVAWLDRAELIARRDGAVAQRAAAAARLQELERGFRREEVAQAREALRAAEERLAEARRERDRAERLFAGGAISQRQHETAATAVEVADARVASARDQVQLLETGPRQEQIAAQRALVRQAEAAVAQVEAALANAVVRAPFRGRVTIRHREPGESVGAGTPVLTVANFDDRWVRVYVRGDEVGRLGLGTRATITADAFPDRAYEGEVVFIADEAEFTPRNVQTTQERVKLVYRVKVRIVGDSALDLKPGLPADVRLTPPVS
ncbi:MAG: HlyD family efflux transporter periplasmic adaptor subunit [Gemmatimonadota bacterium]|nr:HlyD family efflux transporter periplasmic adaptor subunit [Gemmatimonadota bacterium]